MKNETYTPLENTMNVFDALAVLSSFNGDELTEVYAVEEGGVYIKYHQGGECDCFDCGEVEDCVILLVKECVNTEEDVNIASVLTCSQLIEAIKRTGVLGTDRVVMTEQGYETLEAITDFELTDIVSEGKSYPLLEVSHD